MRRAVVLFAHGARDARWAEPFEAVAAQVRRAAPTSLVRLAFLELMTPTLADAIVELVAAGAASIDVVPLFLGTGGHVRRDLPALVDACAAAHPALPIRLHPPVGEQAAVIEAIAAAALAASGLGE
ncbi:MAG: CbiX/SirB N-terminal domain-containing protein [Caldimonas sp.]